MKLLITTTVLLAGSFAFASSHGKKITKKEYVDQWSAVAVEQMHEFGIPASITMAQAILESASGNSDLARKGNNHFGIKCHGWKGKKMYKDDDNKDDCFRVYKSADKSFQDHSDFLKKYKRYAFLFNYQTDDYKSWAKGLKKAGYATNPKYPNLLITIIEDLGLDELDKINGPLITPQSQVIASVAKVENASSTSNTHLIMNHQKGVRYVVVKNGDTFYSIAKEFDLSLNQLYRFNDFSHQKDFIEKGDIVYVQAKKKGNVFKREKIVITKDISVNELSQIHAVQAKTIMKLNKLASSEDIIAKGSKILLR
ncbi:MAG: glucosaminidase domain-containing protein [Fluviicola sp.]|nr:glucosaminidase domain-containing protein [Fluviicola sp.]